MPRAKQITPAEPIIAPICQLKVTLLGTRPPIWRRLLVPADSTLAYLHNVLQAAFGWQNSHLHEFRVGRVRYGSPDPMEFSFGGPSTISEKRTLVGEVLGWARAKAVYTYDFGDSWDHSITVEKILPPDPTQNYPLCTAGELNGPPEDCGGVPGFYNFLEAIGDPKHPDHKDMSEWFPGFDPLDFSVDEINQRFPRRRRARK